MAACHDYQSVSVIGANARGFDTTSAHSSARIDKVLRGVWTMDECCPTGAWREREEIDDVLAAINDKEKHVVFVTAPAVEWP